MDKNSNVGTQYIICECGDNFPNEKLLNIHLANDHAGVEVFQCNACSTYFPSKPLLLQHTCNNEKAKDKAPKINIKPANKKTPPVIKLQNLKRIDSISLIQTLKSYSGLIKLEAAPVALKPEPDTYQVVMEPSVNVKTEVAEPPEEVATEEIYYQCDVCNTIFYSESDFNMHYQSTHAMKVEPTAEEILEDHLVSDHIDDVNVKAEVEADTAYYYECEIVKRDSDPVKAEPSEGQIRDPLGMELKKENIPNTECEIEIEININENVMPGGSKVGPDSKKKVTKKKESKAKKPEPKPKKPQVDVYANLPEGISEEEAKKLAEERLKEIKREKWRQAAKRYRERYPEKSRESAAKYASSHREVRRRASAKYAKKNPEVNRRTSAKYSKTHPEVGRKASARYANKKKMEKLLGKVNTDEENGNSGDIYQDCVVNEYLCVEENKNIDGGKT